MGAFENLHGSRKQAYKGGKATDFLIIIWGKIAEIE